MLAMSFQTVFFPHTSPNAGLTLHDRNTTVHIVALTVHECWFWLPTKLLAPSRWSWYLLLSSSLQKDLLEFQPQQQIHLCPQNQPYSDTGWTESIKVLRLYTRVELWPYVPDVRWHFCFLKVMPHSLAQTLLIGSLALLLITTVIMTAFLDQTLTMCWGHAKHWSLLHLWEADVIL